MKRFTRFLGLAFCFWGLPAVTCAALSPFAEMILARVEVLEADQAYVVDSKDQVLGVVVGTRDVGMAKVIVDVDGFAPFFLQAGADAIRPSRFLRFQTADCTGTPWSPGYSNMVFLEGSRDADGSIYVADTRGAPQILAIGSQLTSLGDSCDSVSFEGSVYPTLKVFDADAFTPPFRVVRASDLVGG